MVTECLKPCLQGARFFSPDFYTVVYYYNDRIYSEVLLMSVHVMIFTLTNVFKAAVNLFVYLLQKCI